MDLSMIHEAKSRAPGNRTPLTFHESNAHTNTFRKKKQCWRTSGAIRKENGYGNDSIVK